MDTIKTSADRFRPYTGEENFSRIVCDATLTAMWQRCKDAYANDVALVFDGQSMTYAGLDGAASRVRSAVVKSGCLPSDRVAILCENSIDFAVLFLGAVTAGCTAVVLPPHLKEDAVFGCVMMFGCKAVLTQEQMRERCRLVQEKRPDLPILLPGGEETDPVPAVEVSPDDPCVIIFTGGSTGKSKGALLSHRAVMQGVINSCYGTKAVFGQRYVLALPLSHVFGLIRNLLFCLYSDSTLMISKSRQALFSDIAAFQPNVLVLVPALAEMALALSQKFHRNMLGDSLHTIICGAAPVPQYLVEQYHEMGIDLFHGYGLTESANLVSGNPEPLKKPGSVGIPYPNQELRIVDGELWLRGDNMLTCYVGSEETAYTQDGWFRTGDLVTVDEDGFLYITGRIKEVIILDNAENIYPAELEAKFNELPFVRDSLVSEAVAENGKHILELEVVLRESEIPSLGDQPRQTAMEKLWEVNRRQPPSHQVSRIVIREEDFERLPSMKIVRHKL